LQRVLVARRQPGEPRCGRGQRHGACLADVVHAQVSHDSAKEIAKANNKLAHGLADLAAGDFKGAIDDFEHAWKRAQ
jgi:hypothetical protein